MLMSIDSARLFIDRMKTDEDFARQFVESKDAENRMEFVKAAGFDFTVAEVEKASGKISEDEFDCIAWIMNLQRFF
jgi:predicted ribosomally synthesized peptide with nif11-like leader